MKVINSILSAIFIQNFVDGKLTNAPVDTVVLLGQMTYFNCSTGMQEKDVHWYFYPVGASERQNVYSYGQLCTRCVGRFQIDNSSIGVFNLIIFSVTVEDAGRYVCQDDEGFGDSTSAEMIVIDDDPVCNTREMTTGFVGSNSCGLQPDIVQLSCRIKYYGNQRPTVTWKKSGDENPISEGANHTVNASYVDYVLTLTADISSHKHAYFCETNQSAISQYRCRNAAVINILYAFSSNIALNKTQGDEEITCSANSSVSCNYKWKRIENEKEGTVSFDKTLKPNDPGTYQCQAECPLGYWTCNITVMTVDIHVSSAEESSGHGIIALYVLLTVLFIIGIVVAVLVIRLLKKRSKHSCPRDNSTAEKSNSSEQLPSNTNTSPTEKPESNALLASQQNPLTSSTSGDTNMEELKQGIPLQTCDTNSSAISDDRKFVGGRHRPDQSSSVSAARCQQHRKFQRSESVPWGTSRKTSDI